MNVIRTTMNNAFYVESNQSSSMKSGGTFLIDLHGKPARCESARIGSTNSLIIRFRRSKLSVGVYTRIWKVNPVARR